MANRITPEELARGIVSRTAFNRPKFDSSFLTPTTLANSIIPARISSRQLETSQGLLQLAEQSGLGKRANSLLKQQAGEDPQRIFSGGFISDIFDVLNAAQYGVTGLLKGKTFSEGVKTRQSFSDKDALGEFGLPGVILGIILDIAVDPLTYLAPYTLLKRIPGIARAARAAEAATFGKKVKKTIQTADGSIKSFDALEGGTRTGKYLASKFAWMFGADPIFRQTYERGIKNIAIATNNVVDIVKPISDLSPRAAKNLLKRDKTGRFIRIPLSELNKTLSPEDFATVEVAFKKLDDLGREAVDVGLLKEGTFEENIGEYIKTAFEEFDLAKTGKTFGAGKVGIKGIKARKKVKDISEFGLTQIENPAYLYFKSMVDLTRDVENAKLLKAVGDKFATDIAQKGFTKIPNTTKWGQLAGRHIPDNMKEYLGEIVNPSVRTIQKQLVANFKFFKVIMNPATHARNIVSNQILNWWKLGMNPLDPRTISANVEALKEIAKGTGRWMKEATLQGYNLDTFAANELKHLLSDPQVAKFGKTVKGWNKIKKSLGDLYQREENAAKLSAFIFNRKKGFGAEEAWKAAESATFNYAQVTPFIRKVRESLFGMPFITFTTKATPVVGEAIIKHPARVSAIGKIKKAIENLSDTEETAKERANEPPWVKDGFYVKLPMKDKQGRSAYFDLTYILPFGDLLAGNFFERSQDLSTGAKESVAKSLLKKSPFIQLVAELGKNKDFYGNNIWRDSDSTDKQLGDLMRHITKTYIPPIVGDQLPGGYNSRGERQQRGIVGSMKASDENQKRNLMEELLRNVGVKIQPIDADIQETFGEWNRKKALTTLLLENGVLKNYNRAYIPKEQPTPIFEQ